MAWVSRKASGLAARDCVRDDRVVKVAGFFFFFFFWLFLELLEFDEEEELSLFFERGAFPARLGTAYNDVAASVPLTVVVVVN